MEQFSAAHIVACKISNALEINAEVFFPCNNFIGVDIYFNYVCVCTCSHIY